MNVTIKYILTVLITAAIVGTGTYYVTHTNNASKNDGLSAQVSSLQNQVDTLNKQVTSLTPSTSGTTVTTTPSTTTPTTTSTAFSVTALKVAKVNIGGTTYQLTNGIYTHPGVGPFGPGTNDSISLDTSNIAIDSANAGQAAIVLNIEQEYQGTMGVGNLQDLEIMTDNAGTPTYLTRAQLSSISGSNPTVNSVTFASNIVTVKLTSGATTTTKTYKLTGSTLVQQ